MKKSKKSNNIDLACTSGVSPPKGKLLFFPAKSGAPKPAARCCCGHEYDGPTTGRVYCCCENCPGKGSEHTEHELGVAFDHYTDPDHPQYDRAFHAEVLAMGTKGVRPMDVA